MRGWSWGWFRLLLGGVDLFGGVTLPGGVGFCGAVDA